MGYNRVQQEIQRQTRDNNIIQRVVRKITTSVTIRMLDSVSLGGLNSNFEDEMGEEKFNEVFPNGFRLVHKNVMAGLLSDSTKQEVMEEYGYQDESVVDNAATDIRGLMEYKGTI